MGYRPLPWPTITLLNRFYNPSTLKLLKVEGIKGARDFILKKFSVLQFMVFINKKSSKIRPHLDKHQKMILSIWTSCFGPLQCDWVVFLTYKMLDHLTSQISTLFSLGLLLGAFTIGVPKRSV